MKILRYAIIVSILFLLPVSSFSSPLEYLRISLIAGDVQMKTEDTEDWVPASINTPLREGDRLWVPEEGKVEIQMRDGSLLRLDESTALEILTVDKDSCQFFLNEGRGYANVKGYKGSALQIDTPLSSVQAYDRSNFSIDVPKDGGAVISLYRGSVYAENKDGRTRIDEGNSLTLGEDNYAELSPLGPPDEWERWNGERDRRFAEQRPSSRYLPDELSGYSNDFEENGRWTYVREYGYVWTPRAVASAEWAPYRVGRWVWDNGDYVWISYEPWGWVPYHYGRWAFVTSVGWCWVPPVKGAVYWGPGFVGWVYTPDYVSWVPLAPGEIYYGRGYFGPHSVNIVTINIASIHVERVVYRNVHIRNAVTVIHHDTFLRGRPEAVRIRENPFLKEKIHIGSPGIKPEATTRMPVIREIPRAKRPPEPVREIRVKVLKEERPLIREKGGSAFKPGTPPKEIVVKPAERRPVERGIEIKKEAKPPEKGSERLKENFPPEKEKTKEVTPPLKGGEKPGEFKPAEKQGEKPREYRPVEKPAERSKEIRPAERTIEKPKEFKPPEKEIEKPKTQSPSEQRPVTKPQEIRPFEKGGAGSPAGDKPVEKRIERAQEPRPQERVMEKPKTMERPVEKPREIRPVEKSPVKIQESKPPAKVIEKTVEKPKGQKPAGGEIEKPAEHKQGEKR